LVFLSSNSYTFFSRTAQGYEEYVELKWSLSFGFNPKPASDPSDLV